MLTKWQLYKILWAMSMCFGALFIALSIKPLSVCFFICALLVSVVAIVDTVRS